MTDAPHGFAADTPLKPIRLFYWTFIVAAAASIAASLLLWVIMFIFWSGDAAGPSMGTPGEALLGVLFVAGISTLVAFPVVLAALLLLALPLTLVMVRRGVAPVTRSLVLLAVAAGAALLMALPFVSQADPSAGYIFPPYAVLAGIFWVLALRRMERNAASG